jgi:hypothetical protein
MQLTHDERCRRLGIGFCLEPKHRRKLRPIAWATKKVRLTPASAMAWAMANPRPGLSSPSKSSVGIEEADSPASAAAAVPFLLGSLLRPVRAGVRLRASSLFSSPCWAPRQDHSRVRGPIPFPLSTFRQPCGFASTQGNSFGLSSILFASAIFEPAPGQRAQCVQRSPFPSLFSPYFCVSRRR